MGHAWIHTSVTQNVVENVTLQCHCIHSELWNLEENATGMESFRRLRSAPELWGRERDDERMVRSFVVGRLSPPHSSCSLLLLGICRTISRIN
uniref:Uncharacterized protein n=1 Tax=Oryza brachyantha TaxID=4533 RepID=J3LDM2_ORYBR